MELKELKFDCHFFRGEIPCLPNKQRSKICSNCDEYKPIKTKILIIKLGAIGDVIRTTPLVTKYRSIYPNSHITWITQSPDILPNKLIDKIYKFNFESVYAITHQKFDIAINLDKEIEACSLLKDVTAEKKFGFTWNDYHIDIANGDAKHKLITGLFDQKSKENQKNYLSEIFDIAGFSFNGEEYLLPVNSDFQLKWNSLKSLANGKKIVGLNTGCGKRWATRLWPTNYWETLIKQLQKENYYPVLLGGMDEDEQNKIYAKQTGAYYPGTFSLQEFIALTSNCDIILSAVSMMMHIAIGLKKPLLLFNNIFNKHEFELYGRGVIIEPTSGCDCYYGNTCSRSNHCMNDVSVEEVFSSIQQLSSTISV